MQTRKAGESKIINSEDRDLKAATYNLAFYTSRAGSSDRRDTRYTTTGSSTHFIELNAANNTNDVAILADLRPDAEGQLKIEISPGANNNSPNHFTYLGVLRLSWTVNTPRQPALISPVVQTDGSFTLQLLANSGDTCIIQSSTDLRTWNDMQTVALTSGSLTLELPGTTWNYLELPGTTWNYLELPGTTWNYLELPGTTWNYLERTNTPSPR